MNIFVYDAAVLIAADRSDREVWSDHHARLALGDRVLVPAPVVAQVSRSPRQAQLRPFLAGCVVVPLDESDAHEAGRLLGKARMADIVDAVVATMAVNNNATILTSDPDDLTRLVTAAGGGASVVLI